jgi:class 3 adenylate cyclase
MKETENEMITETMPNHAPDSPLRRSMTEIVLDVQDKNDRNYKVRLRGVRIAEDPREGDVYLTEAGAVLFHDIRALTYWVVEDPKENLRDLLCTEAYLDVLDALGIDATIDLDI